MNNAIPIVDTHQHLWDLSRHKYSWCAGIDTLNRSFVMSDYLNASRGANIVASIHVEADVDEPDMAAETRWLLSMVQDQSNPLSGLVIKALPEREDFAKYLDQFNGDAAIKGIRRVLHTQADDFSTSSRFRENVRSLAPRGLSFDLCVLPRQLGYGIELVKACPKVQFILDHCGIPDVKGQSLDPWRGDIRKLAELPNVAACKISGLVAYADAGKWSVNDLKPFVDHVVECFGHDRVILGSDWPVCTLTCSMLDWINAAKSLASQWSAKDQNKFFSLNAERVYRI